ncbi:hypothetical protein ACHAXS_013770 [Conticribra weissflogii]
MAPIIVQDHRNFADAIDSVADKSTAEVSCEGASDETDAYILSEALLGNKEERNERDDIAANVEDEQREDEERIEEKSSNFTSAQSSEVAKKPSSEFQHQTSNLFYDESNSGFIIEEEDEYVDWSKNTASTTDGLSKIWMGPSRSFEFPSINTTYNDGNNDKGDSPRFSIPSPSAFLRNVRNATTSFASVLSPTSSMGLEDVDLKTSSLAASSDENLATMNTINIVDEKEVTATLKSNIMTADSPDKKIEENPPMSAPGSIFGMEPFPWEIKRNRMQKPKPSSANINSTSSFASSVLGSNNFSSFSSKAAFSNKFVDSIKKWGKEVNFVVNEFFNEDECKDAFVAHFGRQVSRGAAENYYNQHRNPV